MEGEGDATSQGGGAVQSHEGEQHDDAVVFPSGLRRCLGVVTRYRRKETTEVGSNGPHGQVGRIIGLARMERS
jgi:hypothetical protein